MRSVFFFYQGTCYIWTLSGGRGTDPVKVHLKKTFEAHSKYGIKCLFSPDSTYAFYYYNSSMHEADLFLGHLVFLEILCIAYFFYIICTFVSNRKVKWSFILSY